MAGEPVITVSGNLTADPELRFTGGGDAVVNFTVADTPRVFNRQTQQWEDGETIFMRCTVWRQYAENVSESLQKGMAVIATGRMKARSFEDKQGNNRTSWELDVEEVGPSLRFATAQVQRGGSSQGGWGNQPPQQNQPPQGGWGAPQQGQGQGAWQQPGPAAGPGPGQEGNPWAGGQAGYGQQPPQQQGQPQQQDGAAYAYQQQQGQQGQPQQPPQGQQGQQGTMWDQPGPNGPPPF